MDTSVEATVEVAPAGGRSPTLVDVLVGVATFAVSVGTAALTATRRGEDPFTWGAALVLLAASVLLVIRRRHPLIVWWTVGTMTAVYGTADWADPLVPFQLMVAIAAVVEVCRRRTVVVVLVISTVVAVLATAFVSDSDALDWGVNVLTLAVGASVGEFLRTRRLQLEQLTARNERLRVERGRAIAEAQLQERRRIARELHDVVTHNVTMLVVQAEAAASTTQMSDSERIESFDALARNGRSALVELRHLLGVLRDPAERAPEQPVAGLDQIVELVAGATRAGLDVDYQPPPSQAKLPSAVELAAYRVVQEGLTNVLRHAGASRAVVTIDVDADRGEAVIAVEDDGRGREVVDGTGLTGLRERVHLLGGTIDAGPGDEGVRLCARIPLGAAS